MINPAYTLSNILAISDEQLFKCVEELTFGYTSETVNSIAHQIVEELGLDYTHSKEIVTLSVLKNAASKWAYDYKYNRN